ncbi:MAG TPA: NADP-dependent oxidoreductase [Acidimicrobiales bacterium]|jgi:NADPH:quinone reductase-like Zn-dependent oxidoreductase|nr:NADP-dependent oxidoreductase [Acidimicrobiales bacterium]
MSKAVVLTNYGPPDVLVWSDVLLPEPGPGQVRIRIKAAGVSPTDPKIRRGDLRAVFPLPVGAVLGFEAAGEVDALGPSVSGVDVGDEVASLLSGLGGYGEYTLASSWTPKPPNVSWSDAAALPASAEAAVGVLKQLGVAGGETLLVLGAAGSVGMIAVQLAVSQGVQVIGAASAPDHDLVRDLGGVPVGYGAGLADRVREISSSVDAVLDAASRGAVGDAITLGADRARILTLADEHAADLGVSLSAPTPDRAPEALDQTMPLLASGALRLRGRRHLPLTDAAEAHRVLENGEVHEKLVLEAP